jgi:hypothetical protein
MDYKKVYRERKARMAKDPDYKRRVLASQAASRAKATDGAWTAKVLLGLVCPHRYPNGRHCWKTYEHTHGGTRVGPFDGTAKQTS